MSIVNAVRRALESADEIAADEERADAAEHGRGQTCGSVPLRHSAQLTGVIRSLVLRPRNGVPALEAELYDGSGVVRLVWMGRRQIAGIEPGRRMHVEGFVSGVGGRATMFNPRYELRVRPGE